MIFNFKKNRAEVAVDIEKEKKNIDKELELYREDQKNKIDREILDLARKCAEDTKEYEHDYHQKMQELETELAVLEARKDSYKSLLEERNKNLVEQYNAVLKAKDHTIAVLEKVVEELSKKAVIFEGVKPIGE